MNSFFFTEVPLVSLMLPAILLLSKVLLKQLTKQAKQLHVLIIVLLLRQH
jgi:hypothetical protein